MGGLQEELRAMLVDRISDALAAVHDRFVVEREVLNSVALGGTAGVYAAMLKNQQTRPSPCAGFVVGNQLVALVYPRKAGAMGSTHNPVGNLHRSDGYWLE